MPDFRSFLTRFGSYLGIVSGFMYLNQTASSRDTLLIQVADNIASIFRKAFSKTVELFRTGKQWKSGNEFFPTIYDAYEQLTVRYTRDIPDLFKYNAFVVISDGVNNKYGSLFADYDYFYAWRKVDDGVNEVDGINSLYSLVKGLFRKDRLLAVIKDFIYFPDHSQKELKVVCRYPQYFAATKLLENIKLHQKPQGDGKGGTYFGATGCGKSFTMLFLTRMIMRSEYFKSPTIVLITDRTDLDTQLSATFCNAKKFIGDNTVESIESRAMLREKLQGRASGGVYLTTIQKFTEDIQLLSDRTNIICISDEAHRSQVNLEQQVKITDKGVERHYGFAKYLHDSLPNATYQQNLNQYSYENLRYL